MESVHVMTANLGRLVMPTSVLLSVSVMNIVLKMNGATPL